MVGDSGLHTSQLGRTHHESSVGVDVALYLFMRPGYPQRSSSRLRCDPGQGATARSATRDWLMRLTGIRLSTRTDTGPRSVTDPSQGPNLQKKPSAHWLLCWHTLSSAAAVTAPELSACLPIVADCRTQPASLRASCRAPPQICPFRESFSPTTTYLTPRNLCCGPEAAVQRSFRSVGGDRKLVIGSRRRRHL